MLKTLTIQDIRNPVWPQDVSFTSVLKCVPSLRQNMYKLYLEEHFTACMKFWNYMYPNVKTMKQIPYSGTFNTIINQQILIYLFPRKEKCGICLEENEKKDAVTNSKYVQKARK